MQPVAFGRFVLLERIAVGGMAEVFRARFRTAGKIDKMVVVKRILPAYANQPDFVAMFRDEAEVTLRLTHSNIVQVFEFGSEEGAWFLVMEHVHGRNLRDLANALLAKRTAFPAVLAVRVAAEVAGGLHHAHTRTDDSGRALAVVHRDVSPQNILVSYEGEVKITDFGIAKASRRHIEKTEIGVLKGKLPYMAPEQIHNEEVDARTDVFGLGAVLWELLTGQRMAGDGLAAVEAAGSPRPYPSAAVVRPDLPPAIEELVARAVEKEPRDRFPTAQAFAREAARAIRGLAVTPADLGDVMAWAFQEGPRPDILADIDIITADTTVQVPVRLDGDLYQEVTGKGTGVQEAAPVTYASVASPVPRGSGPARVSDPESETELGPAAADTSVQPAAVERITSRPTDPDPVTSASEASPVPRGSGPVPVSPSEAITTDGPPPWQKPGKPGKRKR